MRHAQHRTLEHFHDCSWRRLTVAAIVPPPYYDAIHYHSYSESSPPLRTRALLIFFLLGLPSWPNSESSIFPLVWNICCLQGTVFKSFDLHQDPCLVFTIKFESVSFEGNLRMFEVWGRENMRIWDGEICFCLGGVCYHREAVVGYLMVWPTCTYFGTLCSGKLHAWFYLD